MYSAHSEHLSNVSGVFVQTQPQSSTERVVLGHFCQRADQTNNQAANNTPSKELPTQTKNQTVDNNVIKDLTRRNNTSTTHGKGKPLYINREITPLSSTTLKMLTS